MKKLLRNGLMLSLFIAATVSCNPKKTEESNVEKDQVGQVAEEVGQEKTLHDEVIALHDEVMPKMQEIMQLRTQLEAVKEGLADAANPVNEERKKALEAIIAELTTADEGMMQWMRGFKPLKGELDDSAKAYLEKEKIKIIEVKENMLNAIAKAEGALEDNE